MKREVRIEVGFATDWEQYSEAWATSMNDLYWYNKNPVFDFNKDEEFEEMRLDFDKSGNLFLVARLSNSNKIVGVLGLHYKDVMARIRRWEPAVLPEFRNTSAAEDLLNRALKHLMSIGIKRIGYLLKYPFDSPELVKDLLNCYRALGFNQSRPDSVDLVMHLGNLNLPIETPPGVTLETGENYTIEDLASLTVRSFTSTPEERDIHGFDKTVTEHIQATALLQRMADGFYGYSPNGFRKIAVVDGLPVGFLGAFVVESEHQPLTGVLGPMAVLPGFRRQGIALYLINEILHSLKEFGCKYAAVGTPAENSVAIKLYEKAGFKLACRIVNLEKEL